jgi:hypothetical protein
MNILVRVALWGRGRSPVLKAFGCPKFTRPETSGRRCFGLEGIGKSDGFLNKRRPDLSLYHEPA